jgi:hypothetical protein
LGLNKRCDHPTADRQPHAYQEQNGSHQSASQPSAVRKAEHTILSLGWQFLPLIVSKLVRLRRSGRAILLDTQNEPLSQHPARSGRAARCVDYPWGARPWTYHDRAIPTTWQNDNTVSGHWPTTDGVQCCTVVSRGRGGVILLGTAGQHPGRVHGRLPLAQATE